MALTNRDGPADTSGSVAELCLRLWGNAAVEHRARVESSGLLAAGFAVALLTQQPVDERVRTRWPELAGQPVTVVEPGALMQRRTATKLLAFAATSARFASRLGETSAIVSHTSAGVVGATLFARRRGTRVIYVCHESPPPKDVSLPARHRVPALIVTSVLDAIAVKVADLVVCPAPSSRDFYAAKRRRRATITLENPVDTQVFTPDPDPDAARDIDVLFVGRMTPEKGADVLVRAVALVDRPLRVVMIGGGTERTRLEALALGCAGEVTFPGVVPNDELVHWYRRARIVAVPSYTEAAGMVAVEAMACATPVLASRVTGLVDSVVDGVNGWLVTAGDVDEWAGALAAALDDDETRARLGDEAVVTARRFSNDAFVGRLVDAYGLQRAGS